MLRGAGRDGGRARAALALRRQTAGGANERAGDVQVTACGDDRARSGEPAVFVCKP